MGDRSELQAELQSRIAELKERHGRELAPLYAELARCGGTGYIMDLCQAGQPRQAWHENESR